MPVPSEYLRVDEQGLVYKNQTPLESGVGADVLKHMRVQNGLFVSELEGTPVLIEAADEPLIAKSYDGSSISCAYNTEFSVEPGLSRDEWGRVHGYTSAGVPFLLTSTKGVGETTPYWDNKHATQKEEYWTEIYRRPESPGWDLKAPAVALKENLHKVYREPGAQALVLGCGEGHDAAFIAQNGYSVVAVDYSPEAISRAKDKYGQVENLELVCGDAFNLPKVYDGAFDLVFEHTCFCAIDPDLRPQLVQTWQRVLKPRGRLMGVFFAFERKEGAPYGSTEWELHKRLADFDPMLWYRVHNSVASRQGRELFVYAYKK